MILGVRCNRNPERSDAHKARPCAERRRLFSPPDKIQKAQRMAACIMLEYRHGSLWVTSDGFCKLLDLVTSVAFLPDSEKGAQQMVHEWHAGGLPGTVLWSGRRVICSWE